jgi:hypothetical protein
MLTRAKFNQTLRKICCRRCKTGRELISCLNDTFILAMKAKKSYKNHQEREFQKVDLRAFFLTINKENDPKPRKKENNNEWDCGVNSHVLATSMHGHPHHVTN